MLCKYKLSYFWLCKPDLVVYSNKMEGVNKMDKYVKKIPSDNITVYRQLQELEHINIIKILSCEDKDGYSFVKEEEFDGQTIDSVLQEQKVTGDAFYDWLLQICDALECLNSLNPPIAGVSLQPRNILIGEDNILKLIDFSGASNVATNADAQKQDIVATISFMKGIECSFMKKYLSLLESLEDGREILTISELRAEIIEAYRSRWGIKHAALVVVVSVGLIMLRLLRKIF